MNAQKKLREFLNVDELPENAEKTVFEEKTVLLQIDDLGRHLLLSRFATEKMLDKFTPLVKNAIKDFAVGVGMLFYFSLFVGVDSSSLLQWMGLILAFLMVTIVVLAFVRSVQNLGKYYTLRDMFVRLAEKT